MAIKTESKTPAWVDPAKVLEWEFKTPEKEGIISIHQMYEEATKLSMNWLLFYTWCYARTSGFMTKGMKNWDYGNFGGQYKTSREGIKDALSEFIKYPDTESMNEGKTCELLYSNIEQFCRGVIWNEPRPLPEPEKPKPPPPIPEPEKPKPDPEKPQDPKPENPSPGKPFPWLTVLVPVVVALLTVGSLFVPGWARVVIDVVIKLLSGLS